MISEKILSKYELSANDMNMIVQSLLENRRLTYLSKKLGSRFTLEQVFVIAKEICKITFEAPIDEISPQLTLDRIEMNEANSAEIALRKMINSEVKKLSEINEDLLYLKMELRTKVA